MPLFCPICLTCLFQVAQVKLFGEEDIQQELFLSLCEWPTDDTRVLIHGYWYASSLRIMGANVVNTSFLRPVFSMPCH